MTDNKMPKPVCTEAVIYVHAKGHGQITKDSLKPLLELDLPICSHLAHAGMTKTKQGYDQPALLIHELAALFPDRPVIFLRAGMHPIRAMVDELIRLVESADQPLAMTLLSNADARLNPFAGLQTTTPVSEYDFAGLVSLLSPAQIHTLPAWTDHFVLLSAELVTLLAGQDGQGTMMQQLTDVGGSLKVADHLFLHDPEKRTICLLDLQPYEAPYPPPFGELTSRLQDWFNAEIKALPFVHETGRPATLHITHSWGGGVAQWLKSFIDTDHQQQHFQLRSENPQSGQGFGQKLSLYAGNELRCPIASWWLTPAIQSVAESHDGYQAILSEICTRYGIGRVLISSLVGQSLDALRSGLPSAQILHDHFPVWPLLSVNPDAYLRDGGTADLEQAIKDHVKDQEFPEKDAHAWSELSETYIKLLKNLDIRIAAPSQSVLDLQNRLVPTFKTLKAELIPHGFPAMDKLQAVLPRKRSDGRMRLVILGRMQTGKGKQLLSLALPELAKYVQVYLLGTGKSGEAFFGMTGVDVILEYQRDDLADILNTIGPHFAALLSVVPETFSFTLSELQRMQIPVLATRVGSFPGRIKHGETGWLVDVNPDALIQQVTALCESPEKIENVRSNLAGIETSTLETMLAAYDRLCPVTAGIPAFKPVQASLTQKQHSAIAFQGTLLGNQLQQAVERRSELAKEVEQRTEWALESDRQLKLEQKRRVEWVGKLEAELEFEQKRRVEWVERLETEQERLQQMVAERQASLQFMEGQLHLLEADYREVDASRHQVQMDHNQLQADHRQLQSDYQQLQSDQQQLELIHQQLQSNHRQLELFHQQLEQDHQQLRANHQNLSDHYALILGSFSWKITRPLRAIRRVMRNFMLARAWNPARWPFLLSHLIRNLSTQGIKGTMLRLQSAAPENLAQPQRQPKPKLQPKPQPQPVIETETPDAMETDAVDTDVVETEVVEADSAEMDAVEAPTAFPKTKKPKASIIIPVYNKWAYTAACLCSLLESQGKYTFEVIIVDDQSSDQTADQLAKISGLTYLRNETNLGFVGSCNRGARHARGEFMVLLNNDTEATQGWLDELIDTFEREPEAGMVGSLLVYPDGKLQESGGIIFNDASGWNYGRGLDAENPEYHFLREADYCSGASIALRTEYFHKLGALDERYAPAYYEDTDLAFKVRESGLKVFIQPASVIIHHEGVTSGTDTSSGTKQYQLINQKKFAERWQKELQSQPAPVNNPSDRSEIYSASQHRIKKRILVIDATTPEPDKDSGSVRLTNLMQCCRDLGYGVTFFADNRVYAGKYTQGLQRSGIEVLYHPYLDSLHDFFRQRGKEFDYILISRHYVAVNYVSLIKRYAPKARFIFDTVDLHYLREQRLAELEKSKTLKMTAKQTRRSEIIVMKASDATLVVSTVEKEVLAKDAPDVKVHVLSNIHQVPGRDKGYADRKDIFFVGGYQHPPNVDAACWFVKDIWPLIHAQIPDLRFHLIGSKAPEKIRALDGDGVVFHGFVESIDPFLNDCRLAIAPLRYGAGVKGKVNMSMAHGQPVVATPAAVEGMFAEHEREILVAADAEAFANEVVRLYRDEDLWNRLSDASVKNVQEHFSLSAARESLASLFGSFES